MECRQARNKISAYMDHELDVASYRQVEAHLQQCADCHNALKEFQELDDLVRGLPRIELGPDFAAQVLMRASKTPADMVEDQGKLPVFKRLSRFFEDFLDLVSQAQSPSTRTLDEFDDFPPLSMSYIYFHLLDLPAGG